MIVPWLGRLITRMGWTGGGGTGPSRRLDPADPPPVAPAADDRSRKPRLLLVEDDWATHSSLRRVFTRLGWEVDSAMTVSGALTMLEARPQAMILDLMLADGVGLEVLRYVRATRVAIRVVVMTGTTSLALRDEVKRLAPDALILKPIDLHDLLAAFGIAAPPPSGDPPTS